MPTPTKPKRPAAPEPLRRRVKALQKRLRDSKADVLLVTNPVDIRYLTGFVGDDSWLIVPQRGGTVTIFSDSRFTEQITREAPHARAVIRKGGMVDELKSWMSKRKAQKVGLQPEYVTLSLHQSLGKALGKKHLVKVKDKLLTQRSVKDKGEVDAIRRALGYQQQAFLETLGFIEPGMTETRIAAHLEYRMRSLGADGTSFPTIVAVDQNAALPHAIPGDAKVKKSSSILIDWGARAGGYCSDLTRVVAVGKMKPRVREIYKVVLEAQEKAIDAIGPGVRMREVDKVARDHITAAGYGDRFGHGLGHGIGLDIHEGPTLSSRAGKHDVLEPGQVVTVEPGVYLPGVGGVRIEDDVLVTEAGHELLSNLPKSLESAII